ncbi:MAG: hydrogenase maturation protease [Planctomycetota bacterium]|jgi:hydrogenase maturation protease
MSSERAKKNIVVLGLGNPLRSDEGIGVAIVGWFSARADQYPSVDFIDAGTGGMSVLHLLANRSKAVLIDCAYMGTEAGTIKRFEPHEVESVKKLAHQSLHEADIMKIIDLSEQLGQGPQSVVIFGIEPETIELGQNLSKTLEAKMDEYIDAVTKELVG